MTKNASRAATQEIEQHIRAALAATGLSAAEASRRAVGRADAIKRIRQGHVPRIDRVERLCAVLGLEFYIGPPRSEGRGVASANVRYVPAVDVENAIAGLQSALERTNHGKSGDSPDLKNRQLPPNKKNPKK